MAAITVEIAFIILGGILFIGYLGDLLSKRFAVPSALLLLIIGYLLRLSGYVEVEALNGIQALFGTLALIVLLFDGGLSLNIYEVVFRSGRVLMVGVLTTVLAIAAFAAIFFIVGMNPLIGAILGAIAGGIGSTTTISIVKGLVLPNSIRNFLTLESSITDVFSIILTIVLVQALVSGAVDVQSIGQGIVGRFSIGLFIGIVAGVISILTFAKIEKGYNYMMTFAIVLILYAITEFLNGSGAIAVLVFGLVLGNETTIRRLLRFEEAEKRPLLRQFQAEISFFIRTFFFVFLGIVVNLGSVTNFIIALALMIVLYAIRYVSIYVSTMNSELVEFQKILVAINPRGLATAVLATYPAIVIQNMLNAGISGGMLNLLAQVNSLPEIAFYMILLSIIITTVLVPLTMNIKENKKKKVTE